MKLQVFDPPMCCSSGVCGPSVDPKLVQFKADLDWLANQGITVERFNMSSHPGVFAQEDVVKQALKDDVNCLPLVVVEGAIIRKKGYPSRAEMARACRINGGAEEMGKANSPAQETTACGPGCNCGAPSGGGKAKVVVSVVAMLAIVGIIGYKAMGGAQQPAKGNVAGTNQGFAVAGAGQNGASGCCPSGGSSCGPAAVAASSGQGNPGATQVSAAVAPANVPPAPAAIEASIVAKAEPSAMDATSGQEESGAAQVSAAVAPASVAPAPASSEASTAAKAEPAASDGGSGQKAADAAKPDVAVPAVAADSAFGESLVSLSDLNKVAMDQDSVFVLIPAKGETTAGDATKSAALAAKKTLGSKDITVGLYTLKTDSADYPTISSQVETPAILVAIKGKGMGAVSGEVTEEKLLQAFTASSRAGGCGGASGCGPGAAGCGPR